MNVDTTRARALAQGVMRIIFAFIWWAHGAQKFVGWFGGFGPEGGTADLMSRYGIAAVIEFFGGPLLMLGLFTRPVAFIASGEMAGAYFLVHVPGGGFWPWNNGGEVVALLSFGWLFFAVAGAGAFSVDAWRSRRKHDQPG